jgi:hypothetical protein
LRGREFEYEVIAPVVLGIKERRHGGRKLTLALIVAVNARLFFGDVSRDA